MKKNEQQRGGANSITAPSASKEASAATHPLRPFRWREKFFAFCTGLWLGISLLKFGNPIIFENMIGVPRDWAEFILTPWPVFWGYIFLAGVVLAGIPSFYPRFRKEHRPIALLGFWLFWQFLSSARSVDPRLSNPTLIHFTSCVVCFLLGWWALARFRFSGWFWSPVLFCFFYVLFNGFDQNAGGLEATRKAFYAQPNWESFPKEYLLKIQSNRIFSTLVYPNALAGLILLLTPAALWQAWQLSSRWPRVLRGVCIGLFAYLAVACFYWTGSKGGWLIALCLAGIFALQLKMSRRLKVTLVSVGVVLGLTAFFIRFSGYFEKGATSVSARVIYWKAALEITRQNPILGTGPGTFAVPFRKLKPPDAEMAKLTHNDYLEQASDSGLPGAIAFGGAIGSFLYCTARRGAARATTLDRLLWLGLLGWALQAFIEFGLYIPAIAWPAFLFFGLLWGAQDQQVKAVDPR